MAARFIRSSLLAAWAMLAAACSDNPAPGVGSAASSLGVTIDGSSTVFPIHEAVAEAFQAEDPRRRVTIGVSGTGGGIEQLCTGQLDIAGASRRMKPTEQEACRAHGVVPLEVPVAWDGIAVVVHPQADWVQAATVDELRTMWAPEAQGQVLRWSQVRPGWPDAELHLYGPGVDSGTYDYFTQAIVGKEHSSRGDYTASEDDNVLVQGISSDRHALGFVGLAYYEQNRERLRALAIIEPGKGPAEGVRPGPDTVRDGSYHPLSRPLYIYVSAEAARREPVREYVRFLLESGPQLVEEVGFVPLPEQAYAQARVDFEARLNPVATLRPTPATLVRAEAPTPR